MIVGTEGTTVESPEQGEDTTAGKTYPKNQGQGGSDPAQDAPTGTQADPGDKTAQKDQNKPTDAGTGNGGGGGAGGGGKGGGGKGGGGGGAGDAQTADDPLTSIAKSLALADAIKPLQAASADLYSADKQKAVQDSYEKAVAPTGDLRLKLNKAHADFQQVAGEMKPVVTEWVKLLGPDKPIGKLLQERKDLKDKLKARMGEKESGSADAQATTKRWADANANWAAPADKMTAMVGQYADKITKLNEDLNGSAPNTALLSFWFEVAPQHLQLDDKELSADAKESVSTVSAALAQYGLDGLLQPGKDRKDGSLTVIDPKDLTGTRIAVFKSWMAAARAQADADAAFKLAPDDTASLKQRWDKLKDDAWLQEAKKQPLDAAAS